MQTHWSRDSWNPLVIAGLLLVGCGSEDVLPERTRADLDPHSSQMAALGVATLRCLGTVSPDSYVIVEGRLTRTFTSCTDPKDLKQIDALLGLQIAPGAEAAARYMSGTWQAYQIEYGRDPVPACPRWTKIGELNQPTPENVAELGKKQPAVGESFVQYRVESDACSDARCAVRDAVRCAGGFGEPFIVSTDEGAGTVLVDPVWWLDDSDFPPDNNPFRTPGYFHTMSYYGAPPGAVYGAVQRIGEYCSKYYAGAHYKLTLKPVYCAPDWLCVAECR
jgi:hypothetical protein